MDAFRIFIKHYLNVFLKLHLLLNCGKKKLKIKYSNKLHIKDYFIYITTLYVHV
jgi:hypothetical protein